MGKDIWEMLGSLAGCLSLAWMIYEKSTTKPKLLIRIRQNTLTYTPDLSGLLIIKGDLRLEIGNVGKEATTITKVDLVSKSGVVIDAFVKQKSDSTFFRYLRDEHSTAVCETGVAFVELFNFYDNTVPVSDGLSSFHLLIHELGGKIHRFVIDIPPSSEIVRVK